MKKSSSWFGCLLSKCAKHEENWEKFCVLLRKSELYGKSLKNEQDKMHRSNSNHQLKVKKANFDFNLNFPFLHNCAMYV